MLNERVLKFLNALVSLIAALLLLTAGAYSVYALWDNSRVYAAAENVQADMLKLKPAADDSEEQGASFEELLAVNPDVCGWLTLDHTQIDYPILQGSDNLAYINTDVYGDFALAGSIFLDSGCDNTFHDAYSLLYGHHMDNHRMFGDLDLYKNKAFFDENTTGTLILPDRTYQLTIMACMVVPASENMIFQPQRWQTDVGGLLDFVTDNAMWVHQEVIDRVQNEDDPQILGMSTCSTEFTDARTILLAVMEPYTPEN